MTGLLGKKIGMTSIFDDAGQVIPCTVIEAGPCFVTQVKTKERDGYEAVQLGFDQKAERLANKPMSGHFAKANTKPVRIVREFRGNGVSEVQPGQEIKVEAVFTKGDTVSIIGTSKGRGFQGVVKRHHFGGGFRTHGQSDRERAPGSIGSSSYPSRVFKGLRMAGRMGGEQVTVRNLKVVGVIPDSNLLLVKGSVPGAINGYVEIHKVVAH
ncbi:MAG: 50S ribosomal protein L3 [Bacteroidetes bacterium]|nr:50S ribosomal protein L3 [Bacteroidota bacterium]MCW5896405.1 50S ribosomal protein L3 [Bacteroidota bacterium]